MKKVLTEINENLYDIDVSMDKIRFIASELYNISTPCFDDDASEKHKMSMFYNERHNLEMFSSILIDYAFQVQNEVQRIMSYIDEEEERLNNASKEENGNTGASTGTGTGEKAEA